MSPDYILHFALWSYELMFGHHANSTFFSQRFALQRAVFQMFSVQFLPWSVAVWPYASTPYKREYAFRLRAH